MTPTSALDAVEVGTSEAAERLRHAVTRLARLLRQQDQGGLGATATAALATVNRRGALTLGELAAAEQVSPPTMTKVVEKLELAGLVGRCTDPSDRRVTRVSITGAGRRYLDSTRDRRTAWLAGRLGVLDATAVQALVASLGPLEALIGAEGPSMPGGTRG
jgi:DNA-binding MarR family transcriptional regulator